MDSVSCDFSACLNGNDWLCLMREGDGQYIECISRRLSLNDPPQMPQHTQVPKTSLNFSYSLNVCRNSFQTLSVCQSVSLPYLPDVISTMKWTNALYSCSVVAAVCVCVSGCDDRYILDCISRFIFGPETA